MNAYTPRVLLAFLALAGCAISLVATAPHGPGLSPDSVAYVSTARNLVAGRGLTTYRDLPLVVWPPLYPALLAFVQAVSGVDPLVSARWLNAVAFGLCIGLAGSLARRAGRGDWSCAFFAGMLVLAAGPLFRLSAWLLTEAFFAFLVLAFLVAIKRYVEMGGRTRFWLAVLIAVAGFYTRYLGVTLVGAGGLIILLGGQRRSPGRRVAAAVGFGLCAGIPVALWLGRNYAISGTLTGSRGAATRSWSYNIQLIIEGLGNYVGLSTWAEGSMALFLVCGLVAAVSVVAIMFDRSFWPVAVNQNLEIATFVVMYIVLLVWSASTHRFDPISERLLSPLFAPLGVAVVVTVGGSLSSLSSRLVWVSTVRRAVSLVFAVLLVAASCLRVQEVRAYRSDGVGGYSALEWRESETLRYLMHAPAEPERPIFSNRPDFLYLMLEEKAFMLPPGHQFRACKNGEEAISRWPLLQTSRIVWFHNHPRRGVATTNDLARIMSLSVVAELRDGVVYQATCPADWVAP